MVVMSSPTNRLHAQKLCLLVLLTKVILSCEDIPVISKRHEELNKCNVVLPLGSLIKESFFVPYTTNMLPASH